MEEYNFSVPYRIGTNLENKNDKSIAKVIEYRINEEGISAILELNILDNENNNKLVIINMYDLLNNFQKTNKIIVEKEDGTKSLYTDVIEDISNKHNR